MNDDEITQASEQKEAFLEWRRGAIVQMRTWSDPLWRDFPPTSTIHPHYILRRKPQPKLRRWNPEEVPVGAIIRQKANHTNRVMITACVDGKIFAGKFAVTESDFAIEWGLDLTEYSMDLGKTWQPCGVVE